MKYCFISIINRCSLENSRSLLSCLALLSMLFLLVGCGWDPLGLGNISKPIDNAINEIEKTRQTIQAESTGWRDELPKLVSDLNGIESQASSDVKGILADTTNQVQDLATQTIQFSDAKAQNLIAQAGVEYRCNAIFTGDLVKAGVVAELQSIEDDLKFWKEHKTHQPTAQKPPHAVCWINPSTLSLYPSGNNWLIDTSNMPEKNIMSVFGYNFRSDALPTLELHDTSGHKVRNITVTAAYITRFQVNLDFSNENFPDVKAGETAVFNWPDKPEDNSINLTLHPPAKLKISNPVFTPSAPTAQKDFVTLKVTITNQGGSRSGNFVVQWKPDPNDLQVLSVPRTPLSPGESSDVSFSGYTYQRGGTIITSTVSLSNGDDTQSYPLSVATPPPTPRLPEQSLPTFPQLHHFDGEPFADDDFYPVYGGACDTGYQQSRYIVTLTETYGGIRVTPNWVDAINVTNCQVRVHVHLPAGIPRNYVTFSIDIKEKGK